MIRTFCYVFLFAGFFASPAIYSQDSPKHLFILSGQSNMQGLRPQESFLPAIDKAFGKENRIVVFDALGGQPIRRWHKNWKPPERKTENATPRPKAKGKAKKGKSKSKNKSKSPVHGDLYDRLMAKVKPAIKDQKIASVTFIWMQGERDAREQNGSVYASSLQGLLDQLAADLKRTDINLVLGRLSDFDLANKRYPHWTRIREIQVAFAEKHPRGKWVNTDDLNDGLNRKGKSIKNDLHMSADGYKIMGTRFAESAIALIRKQ